MNNSSSENSYGYKISTCLKKFFIDFQTQVNIFHDNILKDLNLLFISLNYFFNPHFNFFYLRAGVYGLLGPYSNEDKDNSVIKKEGEIEGEEPEIINQEGMQVDENFENSELMAAQDARARITARVEEWKEQRLVEIEAKFANSTRTTEEIFGQEETKRFRESEIGEISDRQRRKDYALDIAYANAAAQGIYKDILRRIKAAERGEATQLSDAELDAMVKEAIATADRSLKDEETKTLPLRRLASGRKEGQQSRENTARRKKPEDPEQATSQEAHTKESASSEGQEETEQVDMSGLKVKLLGRVKELFNTIVSLMDDPQTGLNAFAKVIIRDPRLRNQVAAHLHENNTIACQLAEQTIQQLTKDAPIENARRNMKVLQELLVSLTDRVDEISNSNAAATDRTQKDRLGQYSPASAAQSLIKVISTIYGSVTGDLLHASCSDDEKPGGMRVQRRDLSNATRDFFRSWASTGKGPLPNEYHPQLEDLIDLQIPDGKVLDFADLVNQVIHRNIGIGEELETALDNILGEDTRTEDKDDKDENQEEQADRPDLGDMIDAIVMDTSTISEGCLFETINGLAEAETDPSIQKDLKLLFAKLLRVKEDRGRGSRRGEIDPGTVRKVWEEIASQESLQKHPPNALTHEAALRTIERYTHHSLTGNVFWGGLHFLEILYDASRDGNFVGPLNRMILQTAEILAHYANLRPLTVEEIITEILSRDRRLETYLSEHGLDKERILNEMALRVAGGIRPEAISLDAEAERTALYNETLEIQGKREELERERNHLQWKVDTAQEAYDELRGLVELINRTTSTYGYIVPEVQQILDEITGILEETAADQGTTRSELLAEVKALKSRWATVLPRIGVYPADLVCRQLMDKETKPTSKPGQILGNHLETIGAKTASKVFYHVEWLAGKVCHPLDDSEFTPEQIKDIATALQLYHELVNADGAVNKGTIKKIERLVGIKGIGERFLDELGLGGFEQSFGEGVLESALSAQTWQDRLKLAELLLTYAIAEKQAVPRSLVSSLKVDMRAPLEFLVASALQSEYNVVTDSLQSGDLSRLENPGGELLTYLEWLRAMDVMPPTFDFDSSLAQFMFDMSKNPDANLRIPKSMQIRALVNPDPLSLFLTALKSSGAEHSNLLNQLRTLCEDPTASISIPPFIRQYLIERDAGMPRIIATPERSSSDSANSSDEEDSPDMTSPALNPDDPESDPSGNGSAEVAEIPEDDTGEDNSPDAEKIVREVIKGFERAGEMAITGVDSLISMFRTLGVRITSPEAVAMAMKIGSQSMKVARGGGKLLAVVLGGSIAVAGGSAATLIVGSYKFGKLTLSAVFGETGNSGNKPVSSSKSSKGGSTGGREPLSLREMFSNKLLDQQTLGTNNPEEVRRQMEALKEKAKSLGLTVGLGESAESLITRIEERMKQLEDEVERQANYQQFLDEEARKEAARNARKAEIEAEMAENYRQFQEEAEEKRRKQEERQRQKEEERKARRAAQKASEEKPEEGKSSGPTVGQVVSGLGRGLGGVLVFVTKQALQGAGDVAKMTGNLASAAVSSVQGPAQPSPAPARSSRSTRQSPSSASGDEPPYVDDGRLPETSGERSSTRPSEQTTQKGGKDRPAQTPREHENAEEVGTGPITYGDIDIEGERPSGLPGLDAHGPSYVAPSIEHPPAPIHIRDAVEAVWRIGEELTQSDPASATTLQGVADATLGICRGEATAENISTVNDFLAQHGQGPIDTSTSISDEGPSDPGEHEEATAEPSAFEENTKSSEPNADDTEDAE